MKKITKKLKDLEKVERATFGVAWIHAEKYPKKIPLSHFFIRNKFKKGRYKPSDRAIAHVINETIFYSPQQYTKDAKRVELLIKLKFYGLAWIEDQRYIAKVTNILYKAYKNNLSEAICKEIKILLSNIRQYHRYPSYSSFTVAHFMIEYTYKRVYKLLKQTFPKQFKKLQNKKKGIYFARRRAYAKCS